jgi:hypothetical protein
MSNQVRCFRLLCLPATIFLLLSLPGLASAQSSDREPNDSIAQAVQLALPVNSIFGEINPAQDIDFYKVTVQANSEVVFWVHSSSTLDPILAFYNGDGDLLAYNDKEVNLGYGGPVADPMLYVKMRTAGTYYISVCSRAKFKRLPDGATAGGYTLWAFPHGYWLFGLDPYEPNDTRTTAVPINLPFDSNNADLTYLGDIDWYWFRGKAGEKLSIDIEALEPGTHPDWPMTLLPRVGIFDESGRLLQEAGPGTDPESGFPDDPVLVFNLPRDGRYYICVTSAPDEHYNSILSDSGFLADPYVSSARNMIGHYRLRVQTLHDLYFPQVANGSFGSVYFTTSVILVNPTDNEAAGSISFFNSDGTAMETASSSSGETGSTHWFRIPPKGDFVFQSDGTGPGTSGYARVRAAGTVGGSAIFSEYTAGGTLITEAAVGASAPMDFFTFPVDITGEFNTGVALANPNSANAINVSLNLVDLSGKLVASRNITMDKGRQTAFYVSGVGQLFPEVVNFRGSLQVMADVAIPAVALRSSNRTLTTLPAVALDQSYQPTTLYFPQVVVGPASGSYRSTIILTNPSYFAVSGSIRFTGSDGGPMAFGASSATDGSACGFTIPPQGALFLESIPSARLTTGYAVLSADHGLGGVVIFSQLDAAGRLLTEAAVPPAQPSEDFLVFAQSDGGYNTGVALANINDLASGLNFLLRANASGSNILESTPGPLEAGRHSAALLSGADQLFPAFSGTGTLEVRSSVPIPAIALRLTAATMTAVPVIPVSK